MKKFICLFIITGLLFCFSGCYQATPVSNCNSNSSVDVAPYKSLLSDLKSEQTDLYYSIKDIDGNGKDELIVLKNTSLAIYTSDNSAKFVGEHDFLTGTVRFFCSDQKNFPGIFYFTVGGGANHYGYITIKDQILFLEDLWQEEYAKTPHSIEELSSNKDLIDESKFLIEKNRDMHFTHMAKK